MPERRTSPPRSATANCPSPRAASRSPLTASARLVTSEWRMRRHHFRAGRARWRLAGKRNAVSRSVLRPLPISQFRDVPRGDRAGRARGAPLRRARRNYTDPRRIADELLTPDSCEGTPGRRPRASCGAGGGACACGRIESSYRIGRRRGLAHRGLAHGMLHTARAVVGEFPAVTGFPTARRSTR